MTNPKQWIGAVASVVVLLSASCVSAQDWPQWRGPNRDGKVTGLVAPEQWPNGLTKAWTQVVGSGDATPALVGDKLYVFTRQGDDEVTLCLLATDGTQLWENRYAAQAVTGPSARHPGPRSSPVVAEGKVVTLGAVGVLSCLDAATGELVWRKDPFPGVVPQFFTAMSPMIIDGMAIAQLGGQGNGGIMAFDLATGDVKWQWTGEAPEYSSPALLTVDGTKQIVALTEASVVGVGAADGALLWQIPFPVQRRAYNAATPIVDGQTVIYTGAGRGTHAVRIEKQGEGFVTTELWSNPDVAPQFNTPVLKDGLLFGLSAAGNLFCLNAETGQTAWVDGTQLDRGGFGAMLDVGPAMVVLPSSSELVAFAPSADAYSELGRIKVADTPSYAHPVIAGNRIFVRDENSVTMWTFG